LLIRLHILEYELDLSRLKEEWKVLYHIREILEK